MKVKEIPNSVYHTLRLWFRSGKKLNNQIDNPLPIVVSLTSIPSRFKTLNITIKSLLAQEPKPEKIVLWLNNSVKGKVPKSLYKLQGDIFEIKFTKLDSPHCKLVPSLELFPEKIIVTADDDFIYNKKMLNNLFSDYDSNENDIIANRTRYIRYENDELLTYKKWIYKDSLKFNEKLVLAIGSSGVLYPPSSLMNETTSNSELFMELTPKADDLWFKAMAVLNNTKVKECSKKTVEPIPIMGTQFISLKKHNVDEDKNRVQWQALMDYFQLKLD